MPFILSKQFHHRGKLYFMHYTDGDLIPTPSRDNATRFADDAQADALAEEHNKYSETEMLVEGVQA